MKQSFYNGIWGGFYTVASSNMTDMPGQGKVKKEVQLFYQYILIKRIKLNWELVVMVLN